MTRGGLKSACLLWYLWLHAVSYAQELSICPIDAQQYPPPVRLSIAPLFQSAALDIAEALDANSTAFPYNETSFSIGVFTTSDEAFVWHYYHASPLLANSWQGATTVDADSVYRTASIPKLTTIYVFLLTVGEEKWSDPITKWIPELLDGAPLSPHALVPDWCEITIGGLAGQIAGIGRDCRLPLPAPSATSLLTIV